ncbi:similar to SH3 domain binding glutamic acid-rich protein like 2, isoform CRA_a [Rattus norvegicus]|uniref:Similar to SH3 domain binding glutamic acid-rich protein like 2, isoform CRA_a n=1 Tax=Rattus norvegicus TaxID=10116 RepID=A6I1R6_RAT|nr:similar to SH3 domain binding glutamic acid-rich protein like 2, isoform CRA_a [Rattus norvegicus]|eukprot:NP_001131119.1 SH3 domain-binding glutamic acid-rich-like protein 2 [Rattus norvegicus]
MCSNYQPVTEGKEAKKELASVCSGSLGHQPRKTDSTAHLQSCLNETSPRRELHRQLFPSNSLAWGSKGRGRNWSSTWPNGNLQPFRKGFMSWSLKSVSLIY